MQSVIVNLDTEGIPGKPLTEAPGLQFNSGCKFNGTYLVCSSTDLYQLTGDTFDAEDIDAYFEFAQIDFESYAKKRIVDMYLTFDATDGDILEVVATPDNLSASAFTVSFEAVRTGKQTIKADCPKGLKGVYWTFRVRNTLGANFTIRQLEVRVEDIRPRRQ